MKETVFCTVSQTCHRKDIITIMLHVIGRPLFLGDIEVMDQIQDPCTNLGE